MSKFSLYDLEKHVFPFVGTDDPDVILGEAFGKDVALTRIGDDVLVSHVDPIIGAIGDIGWLAVHVACNDIATSGASPRWILLLVLVPTKDDMGLLEQIMRDAKRASNEIGVSIIGGHTGYSSGLTDELMAQLEGVSEVDYIISHHTEQDHSGTIPQILEKYPEARLISTPKAKRMLIDHLQIPEELFITVKDEEVLSLGDKTLKFIYAPWVHWPETMLTYLEEDKILFSCDFFGSHTAATDLYATDEGRAYEAAKRYFAEIVRIEHITGNQIVTSGLDVFDGTPLLDIKPYIKELDTKPGANYGWLEDLDDRDHLMLHIKGIPHDYCAYSSLQHQNVIQRYLKSKLTLPDLDIQMPPDFSSSPLCRNQFIFN